MTRTQLNLIGLLFGVPLLGACSDFGGGLGASSRMSACGYSASQCVDDAQPDWTVVDLDTFESFRDFETYGNLSCADQAVIELNLDDPGEDVFIYRQITPGEITTATACEQSRVHVTVMRRLSGEWEEFDDYVVRGKWNGAGCDSLAAGKRGTNQVNSNDGYPYSWIDMTGGVESVRVIVSAEVGCENVGIQVGFLRTL